MAGLDYAVAIDQDLVFQFREEPLGSGDFGFFTDNFATFEINTGAISFATPEAVAESVPEPTILAGLVALASLVTRRRR